MFHVRIADDALESMCLAAIEAYCIGDGRSTRAQRLETLGYLWGFHQRDNDITRIMVTKLAISISAERSRHSVRPNPQAADLKREFVNRWSPQLTLLGDFHTHPYRDLQEVRSISEFEFSHRDFSSFVSDDFIWESAYDFPIMLAMTICRLKRVRATGYDQVRENVCRFSVGEFSFWLNASVGYLDETISTLEGGERNFTGNKNSGVYLDLGSRYFNDTGDRIQRLSKQDSDD